MTEEDLTECACEEQIPLFPIDDEANGPEGDCE
jgi:hypothetical protein